MSAGGRHTCARKTDGTLWCWGGNEHGEVGIGAPTVADVPTQVEAAADWRQISSGAEHTCGIREPAAGRRELWCWGTGWDGRLGTGFAAARSTPGRAGNGADWTQVDAGPEVTCGLRGAGELHCFGDGLLDPVRFGTDLWTDVGVSVGGGTALAPDGSIGSFAEPLEVGTTLVPYLATTGHTSLDAGAYHTCVTDAGGFLGCFGDNGWEALGVDPITVPSSAPPVQPALGGPVSAYAAAEFDTCAIVAEDLHCWGGDVYGWAPVRISDLSFASVSGGEGHICAIATSGELYCWGRNHRGQLGHDTGPEPLPVPVLAP